MVRLVFKSGRKTNKTNTNKQNIDRGIGNIFDRFFDLDKNREYRKGHNDILIFIRQKKTTNDVPIPHTCKMMGVFFLL